MWASISQTLWKLARLEKLGDDLGRSKRIEWGSVQTLRALEVLGWIENELGRDADDVSKDELLGESLLLPFVHFVPLC